MDLGPGVQGRGVPSEETVRAIVFAVMVLIGVGAVVAVGLP